MSRVTSTFQALSQEVIRLTGIFREGGLLEVVRILEDVQQKEKEKLELTVKWQVLTQKAGDPSGEGCQNGGGGGGGDIEDDKSQLRRR